MGEVKIRNLDDEIIHKLNQLARQHKMSRNKYLTHLLRNFAIQEEKQEMEEKYAGLVNLMVDVVERNTEVMEEMKSEISEIGERMWQSGYDS